MIKFSGTFFSILITFSSAFCMAAELKSQAWWQFRGPQGSGVSHAVELPTTWSASDNVFWKTELPGKGWSSPVVQDSWIWLTTSEVEEYTKDELEKRLAELEPRQRKQRSLVKHVTFSALKIDYQSGKLLQKIELFSAVDPDPIHSTNSYASPTPVLSEGKVYCYFGTFGTCCLEAETGSVLWKHQIPQMHGVGPGSSPVLVDDLLILTCDGMQSQFILALNKSTGKQVWRTERPPKDNSDGDRKKAFSTPLVIEHAGKVQVLIAGAQWFCAYDPQSGKELWRFDHGRGFSNVPAPCFKDGVAYFCSGFSSSELWAIKVDGSGDVTDTHALWSMRKQVPNKPSPVIVGEELYMISEKGIATCVELKSGEIHWTERMSGNYSASPIFADGKIYFCSEEGKTTIISPGTSFKKIAENNLPGQIMGSPAMLDQNLLIRTDQALYRIK